jgi:hypothetical protein
MCVFDDGRDPGLADPKMHRDGYDPEDVKQATQHLRDPDWRFTEEQKATTFKKFSQDELRQWRREEAVPSRGPAWLKHDKQVSIIKFIEILLNINLKLLQC